MEHAPIFWTSRVTHTWMSHVTHTSTSHTHTLHTLSSRSTAHEQVTSHTYERVTSHTYEWGMSHIHTWVMSRTHGWVTNSHLHRPLLPQADAAHPTNESCINESCYLHVCDSKSFTCVRRVMYEWVMSSTCVWLHAMEFICNSYDMTHSYMTRHTHVNGTYELSRHTHLDEWCHTHMSQMRQGIHERTPSCVCVITPLASWDRRGCMGWLRLAGSSKLYVSYAKEPYKRDDIMQKRPMILRSLLIVATPHQISNCKPPMFFERGLISRLG